MHSLYCHQAWLRQETAGEEADFPGRKDRSKLKRLEHNFGVLCLPFTKRFISLAVLSHGQMYVVSQGSAVGSSFTATCSWGTLLMCHWSQPQGRYSKTLSSKHPPRTAHELLSASLLPCASVRGAGISIHKSGTPRLLLMHSIHTNFARHFNDWRG